MSPGTSCQTPRDGFTLIEVMAVLLLTSLVLGVAIDFYIDLSNQSHYATEATREVRRATTLLDRLADDFERALIVKKPPEADPLTHPWVFVAERQRSETGADRVKFVARRTPDRRATGGVSDLGMVSYSLRPGESGRGFDLMRWSQTDLPEGLDRDFPPVDDPKSLMLADGIDHFALRFLDATGEWVEEWDSSQLIDSSELPVAVEIQLALASEDPRTGDPTASAVYTRRVLLPVRPLDMLTLLDPEAYAAAGGEEEEGQCQLKVADCVDLSMLGAGGPQVHDNGSPDLSQLAGLSPEDLAAIKQLQGVNLMEACWDNFKDAYGGHPSVKAECR